MDTEAADVFKQTMREPGKPVPVVDVVALKRMWDYQKDIEARHPDQRIGFSNNVWEQVLPAGTDIRSVSYRCGMLRLIEMVLRTVWTGGQLSEVAFKVAAKMDMKWTSPAVTAKMELENFIAQVHHQAAA